MYEDSEKTELKRSVRDLLLSWGGLLRVRLSARMVSTLMMQNENRDML
jgi:hypothetical protein